MNGGRGQPRTSPSSRAECRNLRWKEPQDVIEKGGTREWEEPSRRAEFPQGMSVRKMTTRQKKGSGDCSLSEQAPKGLEKKKYGARPVSGNEQYLSCKKKKVTGCAHGAKNPRCLRKKKKGDRRKDSDEFSKKALTQG